MTIPFHWKPYKFVLTVAAASVKTFGIRTEYCATRLQSVVWLRIALTKKKYVQNLNSMTTGYTFMHQKVSMLCIQHAKFVRL